MLEYTLILINVILMALISYFSIYLYKNARESSLYTKFTFIGFLAILISAFNIGNILNMVIFTSFNLFLPYKIISPFILYLLFKIWEIRNNQLSKQNYGVFVLLIILVSYLFLATNYFNLLENFRLINYEFLNNTINFLLTIFIFGIFLRSSNLKSDYNFKLISILILLLASLNLLFLTISKNLAIYYAPLLDVSIYSIILYVAIKDLKRSYYF